MSLVGFSGDKDLVTMWAGHNDVFFALTSDAPLEDVIQAAQELVKAIKNQIIAQGAKRVLVLNLADIRFTPFGLSMPEGLSALINNLIMAFNKELLLGLDTSEEIFTSGHIYRRS